MEDKELQRLIYLQQILSKLEESYFTFLTPTGFGAVFLAIFSVTRPGDEIIVS